MTRNLLPLINQAPGPRRVVSSFTGAKEGKLYEEDWQGDRGRVPMAGTRGHASSMMTLGLEALARESPGVSFVHAFPGRVATGLIRGDEGAAVRVMGLVFGALAVFRGSRAYTPLPEVGERHVLYCTSAMFPPRRVAGGDGDGGAGVALPPGVSVARGVDGEIGSGVYSVDTYGESAGAEVVEVLAGHRRSGVAERLWAYTESEWKRVTGSVSI